MLGRVLLGYPAGAENATSTADKRVVLRTEEWRFFVMARSNLFVYTYQTSINIISNSYHCLIDILSVFFAFKFSKI
jgi:hypothetical protein